MQQNSGIFREVEAAAYLKLSRTYLRKLRMQRRGPRFVKAPFIRYRRSDLDAWLEANIVETLTA